MVGEVSMPEPNTNNRKEVIAQTPTEATTATPLTYENVKSAVNNLSPEDILKYVPEQDKDTEKVKRRLGKFLQKLKNSERLANHPHELMDLMSSHHGLKPSATNFAIFEHIAEVMGSIISTEYREFPGFLNSRGPQHYIEYFNYDPVTENGTIWKLAKITGIYFQEGKPITTYSITWVKQK